MPLQPRLNLLPALEQFAYPKVSVRPVQHPIAFQDMLTLSALGFPLLSRAALDSQLDTMLEDGAAHEREGKQKPQLHQSDSQPKWAAHMHESVNEHARGKHGDVDQHVFATTGAGDGPDLRRPYGTERISGHTQHGDAGRQFEQQ